jgi:zinc protease
MKGTQMKLIFATIILTLSILPVVAQQKTPPAPGAARPLNLPKITEKKLANGLTVVLAPLPNVPKLSAILTFRAATNSTERNAHPGIAQIAASVANEGTDTRTSKQIKEELRSMGGTLGLGSDADQTTITATALSEFSTRMFDLMSDVTQHPSFPESELKLAQENTIQQIRGARSDAGFLGNERFQKAVFGNHPYSFVVPDEKSISALTRADLKSFVAKYYIPNTSHLIVRLMLNMIYLSSLYRMIPSLIFLKLCRLWKKWA